MPTVTVTVYRNGQPVKGCRVGLGVNPFDGVHGPEYTDYHGVAKFEVKHDEGGDVFVNGSPKGHWGASSATDITVDL